jgi:lambda family phage tail tape measure protein
VAGKTETRVIRVTANTAGNQELKKLADSLAGVNKNTKEMSDSMRGLSGLASSWISSATLKQFATMSDEIQNMNNKLVSLTGSQESATSTMGKLQGIAQQTNQSIGSVADTYFRMSVAMKDAKISSQGVLDLTKTIANTFRLSGATTEEAANATVQLSQAFSLGVLRGQDLRSVMSQNIVLTQLLRREFGQNLLKEAEKGMITVPRVMKILYDNMEQVDKKAKVMAATFEQSVVKAMDAFKIKIFEINKALGGSEGFAGATDVVVKNMNSIVTVVSVLAYSAIPAMVSGVISLAGALGLLNPLTAVFAASAASIAALAKYGFGISSIEEFIVNLKSGFAELQSYISSAIAYLGDFLGYIGKLAPTGSAANNAVAGYKKMAADARQAAADHHVHAKALILEYEAQKQYNELLAKGGTANRTQDLANANAYYKVELDAKQQLAQLNQQYLSGAISVAQYNEKILSTQESMQRWKFKEGEEDLGKYNDMLRKVEVARLNRDLKEGVIGFNQYDRAIRNLQLENLKEDLEAGRISLEEFNSKLASTANEYSTSGAFRTGLQDYLKSIGTTTQQVADLIKGAFSDLENSLVEFTNTGKLNFDKMTASILNDLERIIIRASIIQPIAGSLLSAITPTAGASSVQAPASNANYSNFAANGAYFDGPVSYFASGGIFSQPTAFKYGSNKTGVMGEAGPEAILPLKRGSGGDLGVKASVTPVTINVINQSGNEVKQTETTGPNGEKMIDILITGKVREAIGSGKLDKVMNQSYGLKRRGS